jgi:hypothetical protein
MSKYLGKTFTILKPEIVKDVISIVECEGYSAPLLRDPVYVDGYTLKDSEENYEPWVIGNREIEELLKKGAITIS